MSRLNRRSTPLPADALPKDTVAKIAPTISEHRKRVLAHPDVEAYYKKVDA